MSTTGIIEKVNFYTASKNDTHLACCNFEMHQLILIILAEVTYNQYGKVSGLHCTRLPHYRPGRK